MFVQVVENTYILMENALFVLLVGGGIIIHKKRRIYVTGLYIK